MTSYRVEVEVERLGPRNFRTRVVESSIPEEMPADMADYLYRQHGVDPRRHGARVRVDEAADDREREWTPPGLREDRPGAGEGSLDSAGGSR